jgi:Flp pilus assembly protein TadD
MYFYRGIIHEELKDFTSMESDLRMALQQSPDQPEVLNFLGYSLVEQKIKLDEALIMIQKAVLKRPESGYITDSLGWIYFRLEKYEQAVVPMERAIKLLPGDPIVNDHLGDVYWKVGRFIEAEFQWQRSLSFSPEEKEVNRIQKKLKLGLDQVLKEEQGNITLKIND